MFDVKKTLLCLIALDDYMRIFILQKDISTELGNIKKEQKTLQQLDKVRTKSPGDQHQIVSFNTYS